MSNASAVSAIVGAIFVIAIAGSLLWNKDELARYQALKNKRRFSGKRLLPEEQDELERLIRKYWWH